MTATVLAPCGASARRALLLAVLAMPLIGHVASAQERMAPLTAQDVITVVRTTELEDEVRVGFIEESCVAFRASAAAMAELKSAGASATVIAAVGRACYAPLPPATVKLDPVAEDQAHREAFAAERAGDSEGERVAYLRMVQANRYSEFGLRGAILASPPIEPHLALVLARQLIQIAPFDEHNWLLLAGANGRFRNTFPPNSAEYLAYQKASTEAFRMRDSLPVTARMLSWRKGPNGEFEYFLVNRTRERQSFGVRVELLGTNEIVLQDQTWDITLDAGGERRGGVTWKQQNVVAYRLSLIAPRQ